MIFLLDTNAFSDLMREHPKMDDRLDGLADKDQVVICSIVRGEIRFGIERLPSGKRRQELDTKATNLFAVIHCESVPEIAGNFYAQVKLSRQHLGLALDENDLWIAATALAIDATLVTRDKDFQQIDGLTVEDWTA